MSDEQYTAGHMVIADAYRYGWSCEVVAQKLHDIGFNDKQIKRLMELGELK